MLEDVDFDDAIKLAIYNLMINLYDYGITEIHMGGLMRLLGVPNSAAAEHDDTVVVFTDEVADYIKNLLKGLEPSGNTIH